MLEPIDLTFGVLSRMDLGYLYSRIQVGLRRRSECKVIDEWLIAYSLRYSSSEIERLSSCELRLMQVLHFVQHAVLFV